MNTPLASDRTATLAELNDAACLARRDLLTQIEKTQDVKAALDAAVEQFKENHPLLAQYRDARTELARLRERDEQAVVALRNPQGVA